VSGLPGLADLHAQSDWQRDFCQADADHLNYTQLYQQLQCDAHRNATIVAYTKQLLNTNDVEQVRAPTIRECNDCASEFIRDQHRSFVNVKICDTLKQIDQCSRDELQQMQQVERQILILASEKQHIDSLHDRMVR